MVEIGDTWYEDELAGRQCFHAATFFQVAVETLALVAHQQRN